MALVRSQSLDDRADRGSVGIQIAGQPGEHMWRTTEILREELFQEKTDGGGRDGRPPDVRAPSMPIPLSFAGAGPAKPSVSNGAHSASSSVR